MESLELNVWLQNATEFLLVTGPKILITLLLFTILNLVARTALHFLENLIAGRLRGGDAAAVAGELEKRAKTLVSILRKVLYSVLWLVAFLVVLGQIGINIAPILATAGVLGLAVSFGAQSLIKDFFNGFFLLLENQIRLGDVAIVNGTGGLVEAINLRTVVLRDLAGVVHIFPNGEIRSISNMTYGWSAFVFDIGVAYKEDTDRVADIMNRVMETLRADESFGPSILEPLEIFGVDDFGDSAVVVKARIKTLPIKQWEVAREYRRRLKKAFDAEGVEIPFPHLSLYFGEVSKPLRVLLEQARRGGETAPAG